MPSTMDPRRGEVVYASMAALMLQHGVEGLTMRPVAEGAGLAPSTLVSNFTDRRRLLAWFCVTTSRRRSRHWDAWAERHRLAGLLPRDGEALEIESIWSGVCELGRRRDDVADVVKGADEAERKWIRRLLAERAVDRGENVVWGSGWKPDPEEVTMLVTVLAGLRAAMVRRDDPLALVDAVSLLERHLAHEAVHLLRE